VKGGYRKYLVWNNEEKYSTKERRSDFTLGQTLRSYGIALGRRSWGDVNVFSVRGRG